MNHFAYYNDKKDILMRTRLNLIIRQYRGSDPVKSKICCMYVLALGRLALTSLALGLAAFLLRLLHADFKFFGGTRFPLSRLDVVELAVQDDIVHLRVDTS